MMQDPMENFSRCARCYTTNKGKSRTTAGWQLLIRMYVWVLQQYVGDEAHWIHRHLICLSFFWAAFTKGIMDRRRQNEKEHVSPKLDKRGCRVRLRQLYDPEKIKHKITSGETAINKLWDPLPKMGTIHAWLGELYNQVHKQMITARVPTHQNCGQQEKEIIQHFKEMWDDKQYDVNHLPVSVDDPDNLFTADEPYVSGAVVPYHHETEEMDYLEEDDPEEVSTLVQDSDAYSESEDDGTTTAQESTDTEIWEGMTSVMTSSDRDYQKLVGLSLEQSAAAMDTGQKVVETIQTDNFKPDIEMELTYLHSQRSESTQQVVKFKVKTNATVGRRRCLREEAPNPRKGEGAQQNTRPPPPDVPQRDHWQQDILLWHNDQGP